MAELAVLSTRVVNRSLLARQMLLERSTLSISGALDQMGGLQDQYAPSGYIGLWTRLADFERDSLTRALEQRVVVQATVLRATIHLVTPRDYWALTAAVTEARRQWWARIARTEKLPDVDYAELAALLCDELADGPRRRSDLVAALVGAGHPKRIWEGASLWLDMVRVPPSGTWEHRRADLYGLADQWTSPRRTWAQPQALAHLIRRYLGAFGPASIADMVSWSGVPRAVIEPMARSMRLRRYVHEDGTELLDLAGATLTDPETPVPVRLLPTWDACLLVHTRRAGIVPEPIRTRLFHSSIPQSVGSFLVDGVVAGTWSWRTDHVEVSPFGQLSRRVRRELDDEAARLTEFHR